MDIPDTLGAVQDDLHTYCTYLDASGYEEVRRRKYWVIRGGGRRGRCQCPDREQKNASPHNWVVGLYSREV